MPMERPNTPQAAPYHVAGGLPGSGREGLVLGRAPEHGAGEHRQGKGVDREIGGGGHEQIGEQRLGGDEASREQEELSLVARRETGDPQHIEDGGANSAGEARGDVERDGVFGKRARGEGSGCDEEHGCRDGAKADAGLLTEDNGVESEQRGQGDDQRRQGNDVVDLMRERGAEEKDEVLPCFVEREAEKDVGANARRAFSPHASPLRFSSRTNSPQPFSRCRFACATHYLTLFCEQRTVTPPCRRRRGGEAVEVAEVARGR